MYYPINCPELPLSSPLLDIVLTLNTDGRSWKRSHRKVNGNILGGTSIPLGLRNLRTNEQLLCIDKHITPVQQSTILLTLISCRD